MDAAHNGRGTSGGASTCAQGSSLVTEWRQTAHKQKKPTVAIMKLRTANHILTLILAAKTHMAGLDTRRK
eukprot:4372383-Pleurochrysis_carterae.AAC.2